MRARDVLPLVLIGGIGAFIVVQSRSIKSPRQRQRRSRKPQAR